MKYKCYNCGYILNTAHTAIHNGIKCPECGKKQFRLFFENTCTPITWVEILIGVLKNNCFDCLKNVEKKCYCKINNLFPCLYAFENSFSLGCTPGITKHLTKDYKVKS